MLKPLSLAAGAAVLLAVTAFAPAPKASVFGHGGLVGHDGHIDGGPTAIRIDAVEDRLWGQILVAGEEHGSGHDEESDGNRIERGPATYPELHITSTRIRSLTIRGKTAVVEALGTYMGGMGNGQNLDVVITVTVEDGKGRKGEDHVAITCRTTGGEIVFERHGIMVVGDIVLRRGAKS